MKELHVEALHSPAFQHVHKSPTVATTSSTDLESQILSSSLSEQEELMTCSMVEKNAEEGATVGTEIRMVSSTATKAFARLSVNSTGCAS